MRFASRTVFGDPLERMVGGPELVYLANEVALVTSHRVLLAGQHFETARIRHLRIVTEDANVHELRIDVDGLEMQALTMPHPTLLRPIELAINRARTGQVQYALPYVPPVAAPAMPPPPPLPPPPTEWGTPLWNPAWLQHYRGENIYRVPRPLSWPRFAVLATMVLMAMLPAALVAYPAARESALLFLFSARRPFIVVIAPIFVCHLLWVHYAWSALPPECRWTSSGRFMPVNDTLIKLFFPFTALYWMFVTHVGVAESTNAVLEAYGSRRRVNTKLAWWACILGLLPGPNLVFAPVLLVAHMFSCDEAQAEMLDRLAHGPPTVRVLGPPAPPTPLRWAALVVWLIIGAQIAALVVWSVLAQSATRAAREANGTAERDRIAQEYATAIADCADRGEYPTPNPEDGPLPQNADTTRRCEAAQETSRRICDQRTCQFDRINDSPTKGRVRVYEYGDPQKTTATRTILCENGRCRVER